MQREDLKTYEVGDTFELTGNHLKLLRAAWWRWEELETGAPAIDGKRPYGNGDVALDVLTILEWVVPYAELELGSGPIFDTAMEVHGETLTALEIVCFTQSFEPGAYRKIKRELGSHTSSCWERV